MINKETEIIRKENLAKNNQKLLAAKKNVEKLFTPKDKNLVRIFTPKDRSAERILMAKDKSTEKLLLPRYRSVEKFLQAKILDNEGGVGGNERRKYSPIIAKRVISPILRKDERRIQNFEEKDYDRGFRENKENERRKYSPMLAKRIRPPSAEPLKPINNIFQNIVNIRKEENRYPFLEEREYWAALKKNPKYNPN